MSISLQERARRARQRIELRRWEYRQRHHAHGVWFRLRRVLAEAERAFAITDAQARELLAEGFVAEAVGAEFQPSRTLLFAPAERIQALGEIRELTLTLNAELLGARCVALVRFPIRQHSDVR